MQLAIAPIINADGIRDITGFGLCIFKIEFDLVKLLRINVRKKFDSDVIYADMAVLSENDFSGMETKRVLGDERQPASLTVCPLMNFPKLMNYAYLQDDMPTQKWLAMVGVLFAALPTRMESVTAMFNGRFADLQPIERVPTFVSYLRSSADLSEL